MIEYLPIEVGDVVEFHDGERITLPPGELDQWEVFYEDGSVLLRIGHGCYDGDEIRAIHKPGTVGALSHEERSRLWDAMGEHLISVYYAKPTLVEAFTDGNHATGATPLEAVMKCVAVIEAQAKENANG